MLLTCSARRLPECGHVFCESCLQDWFSTTLQQHLTNHPNYSLANANAPLPAHLRTLVAQCRQHPGNTGLKLQLEAQIALHRVHQYENRQMGGAVGDGLDPVYTCPTCREEVKTRPVEDFALKAVVRVVAEAMGEGSPSKATVARGGRGAKGKKLGGPWDGFFPARLEA